MGAGTTAYARQLDTYFGLVTDTQLANTYTNNGGVLSLNPPNTPIGAHTTVPYYNAYTTDTWRATRNLTINYGLSYAVEMPPTERNGNQVMLTDTSGNAIYVDQFLSQRYTAAMNGQIYNPTIAFALIHNVDGGTRKYPYNPFYGAVSPRVSLAYNPHISGGLLGHIFGENSTVIRGGFGRLYGRINGDVQVLNPLLSPGLILATQCKYLQSPTTGTGGCTQANFTDTTAFRFGATAAGGDGISPATASAAVPLTLPQPYRPGIDGPGVSIASPVDPSLRPSDVDNFNLSIQRQIARKMLLEVGYIGRNIHHEYIMKNPNQIPYNLSQGGQTFVSAYDAIETALGCTISETECMTRSSASVVASIAPQPFFETALGGATSAYCAGYASCTQAMLSKSSYARLSDFRNQRIFNLWQALDNNANGAAGTGFIFNRSLTGTTTANSTYGGAGQVVSGLSIGTPDGFSSYNGGYVSFRVSSYHGLSAQENFTYSKALGLGAYNQSTSSIAAEDSYNLYQQYGRQGFDQKFIFNTFIVWEVPFHKDQRGFVGRLAGGWTISPVVTAGTGQPLQCVTNNSGQNFGGEDGANLTDGENCIFTTSIRNSAHTYRGILGGQATGTSGTAVNVGTGYKAPGGAAAVNTFQNPVTTWNSVRPPILGIDVQDMGAGPISGLGYLNMDVSVRKQINLFERFNIELSGIVTNVMNHLDFANPSLSLQSSANFGVTKTQGNSPRAIQMGARFSF